MGRELSAGQWCNAKVAYNLPVFVLSLAPVSTS